MPIQHIKLDINPLEFTSINHNSPIVISVNMPASCCHLSNLISFQLTLQPNSSNIDKESPLNKFQSQTHVPQESISEQEYNSSVKEIKQQSKMDSPKALFLFLGKNRAKEKNCTSNIDDNIEQSDMLIAHINAQVEKLQSVNMYIDGWKRIVSEDACFDDYSDFQINILRNRATYLAMVYYVSIDKYVITSNFPDIIQTAIDTVNHSHLSEFIPKSQTRSTYIINSKKTVLQWFRDYRDCDCFPKFKPYSNSEKLPPLLNANPEVVTSIIHFCRKNINTLSVELVHDFLLSQALPQLVNVINQE